MALTIFAAVIVGVLYVFPDVRFVKDAGSSYRDIAMIGFQDETVYLGRLNAVYRGDHSLRMPAIYEHRKDPGIMPPLSENIEAGLGKLFGLDVAKTDMAATFVLPMLIFFLVALLAYRLSGLVYGSLAAASAVLIGMHLFSGMFAGSGKVLNLSYDLPLWFARPITPQMHFVFFVAALYFIYMSIARDRTVYSVVGGILLGALFYVSVFYWVYVFSVIGVLFLVYVSKRDFKPLKKLLVIVVISIGLSIPYWLDNIKTMRHPNYGLLLYRFNIGFTHKAIIPVSALATLLIVFAVRKMIVERGGKNAYYFILSMLAAIMLTLNQQILTGKLFKQSHWTTYTGKFAVILSGVIAISFLMKYIYEKLPQLRGAMRLLAACFFAALLIHGIGVQMNYYTRHLEDALETQSMSGAFKWLRGNGSSDDVILPSPNYTKLSELLPIYTNGYVYYSEPFFCMSLIPSEETRYRMLATYRLFGFSLKEAVSHPYSWDGAIFLTSDSNRDKAYIDAEKAKLNDEYGHMLGLDGLDLVKKYRVDYIFAVNGRDDAVINKLTASGLKKVFDDGSYSILKVSGG